MTRSTFLICEPCFLARNLKKPKHDVWCMRNLCAYCNETKDVYNMTQLILPWDKLTIIKSTNGMED